MLNLVFHITVSGDGIEPMLHWAPLKPSAFYQPAQVLNEERYLEKEVTV